jgi:hypothetical protein
MQKDYYIHPRRFPKNVDGPFYTLGDQLKDGSWCGDCISCGTPEIEAPTLLAPLTEENGDTYFTRQPETEEEIDMACNAIKSCCVNALRYGGNDPKILAKLKNKDCDNTEFFVQVKQQVDAIAKKGWFFWK